MKSGFGKLMLTAGALLLAVTAGLTIVTPAGAQTPPEACAADSLYLISPDIDGVDLNLRLTGRQGLVISWPDLDISQATCYSLYGHEDYPYTVEVTGDFADLVDRIFMFTTSDSGAVGLDSADRLILDWGTTSGSANGRIRGTINLANNGGNYLFASMADTWTQSNTGLPHIWQRTNVVALESGQDGMVLGGFTGGTTINANSEGLFSYDGSTWTEIQPDLFGENALIMGVTVSPADNDHFAVGTEQMGLYVTRDGGETFTQWTAELDPEAEQPSSYRVTAVDWSSGKLFVSIVNFGLFMSSDQGLTFERSPLLVPENLDDPAYPDSLHTLEWVIPQVNDMASDPNNPDRIVVALQNHLAYLSDDGGVTWDDMYGDLAVPDSLYLGGWVNTALAVDIDAGDGDNIIVGLMRKGLYRTDNAGQNWTAVGGSAQPENLSQLQRIKIVAPHQRPGYFFAALDQWGALQSTDSGATWTLIDSRPALSRYGDVCQGTNGQDVWLGTYNGGIYEPGTPVELSATLTGLTDDDLRDVQLGLSIAIGEGDIDDTHSFNLNCQTFQGWAVWRSPGYSPDDMELIGLYDRVNAETCIEGNCGDEDYILHTDCYAEKRAACFDFDTPDTVRFFDEKVYNGFSYTYAVTSFDYGNTAEISAQGLNQQMLFSPRWSGDPNSIFSGNGNQSFIQINVAEARAEEGYEIYVYPNPLRADEGIEGEEGRTVVFTNLPPESRIQVYTVAGDIVITLEGEAQVGGNMYWNTTNESSESVTSGVYIYKVDMPERTPYWGRLAIIR